MRQWGLLFLLLCLAAVMAACGDEPEGPPPDVPPEAPVTEPDVEPPALDTVVVSTVGELIAAIAPDTHILLKPGDYDFSALTEKEILACSDSVTPVFLREGILSVSRAPGLILEAEEPGTARLLTKSEYAEVVTLDNCDGAALRGLVLGHIQEDGTCDASGLRIDSSQGITIEDCGLFGGTYGIWAYSDCNLTVTDTEIYNCDWIFALADTTGAVFDHCRFYDNHQEMFALDGDTEVLIKDTEIFNNRGDLAFFGDMAQITFQGCTFQNNPDMISPEYWSDYFKDCVFLDPPDTPEPGGKDPEGKGSGSEAPQSPAAVDAGEAPGEDPISQSGPAPVSVRYLEPERDHTPYWVTLYDGLEAEFALFTTEERVTDFTLWTLSAEDYTETGAVLFSSIQVFLEPGLDSLPEVMTPDTPVAVQLVFWGDTPGYGISYVDENGTFRRFILSQSGYDGSLLLEEADPLEADFVLPGAVSR